MSLVQLILPEIILVAVACGLFLLSGLSKTAGRRFSPWVALAALIAACLVLVDQASSPTAGSAHTDASGSIRVFEFAWYIRILTVVVAAILLLLAWPERFTLSGNDAIDYGDDAGEFFGLALLSISGVLLSASANDLILLFLALELTSIPTYIMVATTRPLASAQEAGVKYFFLGALAAAIMLFGFSYLYGTTGSIKLWSYTDASGAHVRGITEILAAANAAGALNPWQVTAVIFLLVGFAFKIAAVPLHYYVGDVYEGAATPVTAFLAFIPKTAGFVAIVQILYAVGGPNLIFPASICKLLWWMAVLTMTAGNVLGLLQQNVKRVLAYSSVAHSGYMLVGLTTLAQAPSAAAKTDGLRGVLFYLAAYGISNAAAFAVLIMLPARTLAYTTEETLLPNQRRAMTAETFDDIAGQGRRHLGLGLCMAVACFSLIGIPLTVGFAGKVMLIAPALSGRTSALTGLAIITMINAAIAAAYYLRIVGNLFLRPAPEAAGHPHPTHAVIQRPFAVLAAIAISTAVTLILGTIPQATNTLSTVARTSTQLGQQPNAEAMPCQINAQARAD